MVNHRIPFFLGRNSAKFTNIQIFAPHQAPCAPVSEKPCGTRPRDSAGEGGRKPAHTASREWGGGGDTRERLSLGNQGALESGEEGLGSTGTVAPQQFYPFIKNELRSLVI